MASSSENNLELFSKKSDFRKYKDMIASLFMKCITYFIILCTFVVFAKITIEGAPVILKSKFPFINIDFFTKLPETLVVAEDKYGKIYKINSSDYTKFKKDNPKINIVKEKTYSSSGGGISGPLIGTFLLTTICIVVSLFIGFSSSIYLNEYASKGKFMDIIRLAILNLSSVPSIVFGLFGLGLFCYFGPVVTDNPTNNSLLNIPILFNNNYIAFQGWGISMLSGGFTLALMVLPVIISSCEESLKAIPMGFRESALALGASKWQSISKAVLPYAFPGVLTASILGITRVAGETAPIMFTAALAYKTKLPGEGIIFHEGGIKNNIDKLSENMSSDFIGFIFKDIPNFLFNLIPEFLLESVQAMPYHIYNVSAKIPQSEYTKSMQYGSVFVFMILVMSLSGISIFMRYKYRKRIKW